MHRDKAWRRDKDKNVIRRRKKLLKHVDPGRVEYFEDKENRLAVKHPLDCGNANCGLCHGHKRNKACASKMKDDHALQEIEIRKETQKELKNDMCDFGD
jgi:hypothetical protein